MSSVAVESQSVVRGELRSVAIPREHGGWGLTLEPVVLGLIVSWSWPGALIGLVAFCSFLVRTPLKVVAVDVRRSNWRRRSRVALTIALVEGLLIVFAAVSVTWMSGLRWLWPAVVAAPLVAIEAWYDVLSRSRRLVPELCGAVGIGAVSASIALADDRTASLAWAMWIVLAARSAGSIPFVRAQIARTRHGHTSAATSDVAQLAMIAAGVVAIAVDTRVASGVVALVVLGAMQARWARRTPPPIKVLGLRQMALGLLVAAATGAGIHLA